MPLSPFEWTSRSFSEYILSKENNVISIPFSLKWYQSVQVMGTFDGWSQGEHLSPEYTGSFTKFSTTLLLRPGRYFLVWIIKLLLFLLFLGLVLIGGFMLWRYEIKFLVDGEWKLSPEFPTVREGLMENNLLIVKWNYRVFSSEHGSSMSGS